MLFVFNSDVFSFLIDSVHPRSIPSAALFIPGSGTTNWLCQSPLEEILEGGQRLHYVSWIMTRPGQHHHFTCSSPSPSNQYLLALASSLVMQIGPYILPSSSTKQVTQFPGSVNMMYDWQSMMYSEVVTLRQSLRQASDVFRVRARAGRVGGGARAWLRLRCFSWMSPKCFVPICVRRFGICKAIFSNSKF